MRRRFVVAVGFCALLGGCVVGNTGNTAGDDAAINESARQAAAKRMDEYVAAAKTGSIDSIMTFWSDSARMFEPESPVMTRESMKAMAGEMLKAMTLTTFDLKLTESVAHDHGTVVYQFGEVAETLTPKDRKTAPMNEHVYFVLRWSKQANGTWLADRFMETPMPKEKAAAAAPPAKKP